MPSGSSEQEMTMTESDVDYELQHLHALVFLNMDLLTEGGDYEVVAGTTSPTVTVKFVSPLQEGDVVRVIRPNFKCHKFVIKRTGLLRVELTHLQWVL
jgi:hypothetical protein